MLYDRWLQTARNTPDRVALCDFGTGRLWTFRQLAAAADALPGPAADVLFPESGTAEFVLSVLSAWRHGRVLCPLEVGQAAPAIGGRLPKGIVHLKCTSATTGDFRLVAFTASQLAADVDTIVPTMALSPDAPNLGFISLAHSYGFSNLVLPLLLHGIPLVVAGSPLPEVFRKLAASFPAVTVAAVPALWRMWLDANVVPSNVHRAISAGAPLPLALEIATFEQCGLKIHNFYGSSETGGIAYDSSEVPRTDACMVGLEMPGVKVARAMDGCLTIRSPGVAETYWPEPDPCLGAGTFRTSDLGEVVERAVYLRGRLSDQINLAGRKLSPEQVERVLSQHAAVRECLVFGVPAPGERGEVVVACVAVHEPVAAETLRQFLLAQIPVWQVPREWWFLPSLTASQRGKLSRAEWRKRYLAEKPAKSG